MAVTLLSWTAVPASAAPAAPSQGYHSFTEVEKQLQSWTREHSEAKLLTIGKSAGGRPIYVVQVAAPGGTPAVSPEERPEDRPAVFVGANAAGYHNAGTEAALHLIETLLAGKPENAARLRAHTFYIAPVLNPDAHDAFFTAPRARRSGNALKLDHDRDGLIGEDPADDLDGDGRITQMRIADPAGTWLPSPDDPRRMIRSDAMKERAGAYRLVTEGKDDDGDGEYNEDGRDGIWLDRSFPHAFPYSAPEAGPWSSYAPETRALLDFLLSRRNVAAAVIYGPANNLLAPPQSVGGGGGDVGTQTFRIPPQFAESMGFDPEVEYTIDEIWEVAQNMPFVRQNNFTKERLAQLLGAGAATKVDPGDQAYLDKLAESYKERLKKAGLSADRPGAQYGGGGITPWLYYQDGVFALELDVWGVPKPEKAEKKDEAKGEEPLTLDGAAAMSTEDFLALGQEKIGAFLKENKVPEMFGPDRVTGAMRGGQLTPKAMVERIRQMGGGASASTGGESGGGKGDGDDRESQVLAWVDQSNPGAFQPWKPVTLPDGTKAEVGGLDPFAQIAPPVAVLQPALAAHTETVLDLAGKLARIEIASLEAKELGGGVYRVRAVAANRGYFATHTKMATRARSHLPARLEIRTGKGVELVTGRSTVVSERLEGTSGAFEAEWLVRAPQGAEITVEAVTENAGRDRKTVRAGKGA